MDKTIEIEIRGGLISTIKGIPAGYIIKVYDFDCFPLNPDDPEDWLGFEDHGHGEICAVSEWEAQ